MVTKHLALLVFASALFGAYSFYTPEAETSKSPSRGISSESEPEVVDVPSEVVEEAGRVTGSILRNFDHATQSLRQNQEQAQSQLDEQAGDVDYAKICKLPRNFISDEVYNRYCKNNQCLRAGETCNRDGMCCSQMCVRNVCAAAGEHLLLPGERCNADTECYTNNCDFTPASNFAGAYKICYGDNKTLYCSRVGSVCKQNRHCCSNSCKNNQCVGSRLDPAPIGAPCRQDNSECATNYCNLKTRRCE